jgi:hypothetical protein
VTPPKSVVACSFEIADGDVLAAVMDVAAAAAAAAAALALAEATDFVAKLCRSRELMFDGDTLNCKADAVDTKQVRARHDDVFSLTMVMINN